MQGPHVVLICCDVEAGAALKSHGDLKLAFVITKGQFELDVICAKELRAGNKKPGIGNMYCCK